MVTAFNLDISTETLETYLLIEFVTVAYTKVLALPLPPVSIMITV